MWLENFWIIIHLLVAGFGILALTYYENKAEQKNLPAVEREKFYFFLTLIIQFAFGGLFSTFFVFYLRSTSFSDSWLFILLLLVLLFGNELWKKNYTRLTFQISVLFLSLYLFLIFALPVLFHRLGADLFVLSGVLSLVVIFIFTLLLRKFSLEKFKNSHNYIKISLASIFILMNALYFLNIIPPIPLAIKASGVYHEITRTADGNYTAVGEEKLWTDYFNRYPVFHNIAGDTVYVFSAVFSPANFVTKIIHQWQYYDETKKTWVNQAKIDLPITGGREGGFRTYSFEHVVAPGLWRVRVETVSGQMLGEIRFKVENATATPALIARTL